jgi:hypothetical protein
MQVLPPSSELRVAGFATIRTCAAAAMKPCPCGSLLKALHLKTVELLMPIGDKGMASEDWRGHQTAPNRRAARLPNTFRLKNLIVAARRFAPLSFKGSAYSARLVLQDAPSRQSYQGSPNPDFMASLEFAMNTLESVCFRSGNDCKTPALVSKLGRGFGQKGAKKDSQYVRVALDSRRRLAPAPS